MRYLALALACAATTARQANSWRGIPNNSGDTTIALQTFQFQPKALVIRQGTRVTWNNHDEIEHTVTSGVPDSLSGEFAVTLTMQGAIFTHTFNRAGTFMYFCDRHRFMRGEIRVTSSTGEM